MCYYIKIFVLKENGNIRDLIQSMKQSLDSEKYEIEVRNLEVDFKLQKTEKIVPCSFWQRAIPTPVGKFLRQLREEPKVLGMDFYHQVDY